MNTSFEEVYDIFISKIEDYKIVTVDITDLYEEYEKFLSSSFSKFKIRTNQDDIHMDFNNKSFSSELTYLEKEILAYGMIVSWREPYVNNIENMAMRMNTKDYSQYSQANHLKELSELKKTAESDFDYWITQYNNKKALDKLKKKRS